jgi:hypothetical protein
MVVVLSIELLTKHDVLKSASDAHIALVIVVEIEASARRRGFNNLSPSIPTPGRAIKLLRSHSDLDRRVRTRDTFANTGIVYIVFDHYVASKAYRAYSSVPC